MKGGNRGGGRPTIPPEDRLTEMLGVKLTKEDHAWVIAQGGAAVVRQWIRREREQREGLIPLYPPEDLIV